MAPNEAMELVNMYTDSAIACFSVYISLTFAYLTAGYLAAEKLTVFQIASFQHCT